MESFKILTLVEYSFDHGYNMDQLIYPNDEVNERNAVIKYYEDNFFDGIPKGMLENEIFLKSPLEYLKKNNTRYTIYEVVYNGEIQTNILNQISYM